MQKYEVARVANLSLCNYSACACVNTHKHGWLFSYCIYQLIQNHQARLESVVWSLKSSCIIKEFYSMTMAKYVPTIYPIICQQLLKESVNSDGQRFHQYQPTRTITFHLHSLSTKARTTYEYVIL